MSARAITTAVRALVPHADETIGTRVPAPRYKGKTVVGFGATAQHIALCVMFGDALRTPQHKLVRFDATSAGERPR